MAMTQALERLQRLIEARDPASAAGVGATERQLETLREAVAPLVVPEAVEELYRWRNGLDLPLLGGYRIQSIETILEHRAFEIEQLQYAPAWLVLSVDDATGEKYFATMTRERQASYEPIWSVYTHDVGTQLLHRSLSAAIETFCDIADEADLNMTLDQFDLGWLHEHRQTATASRLGRSPGAFVWPDPPKGTRLSQFVEPDWPDPWLESVGSSTSALRELGDARPIAELAIAKYPRDFPFRVRGKVIALWVSAGVSHFRIADDSGAESVASVDAHTLLSPVIREVFEMDLIREGGGYVADAIRRTDD